MGNKCFVYACKTNYSSERSKSHKISIFFSKNKTEIEKCVKTIGNGNLRVSKDTAVCVTLAITFWITKSQCKISTRPRYDQVYNSVKYRHNYHHRYAK